MIDLLFIKGTGITYSFSTDIFSQYNNLLIDIIDQTTLSKQTQNSLSDYCKETIRNFTIDVVSTQNRHSYKVAAYETIACFEILRVTDGSETAYSFYNMIKERFSKYSAFQRQLKEGLEISKSSKN